VFDVGIGFDIAGGDGSEGTQRKEKDGGRTRSWV